MDLLVLHGALGSASQLEPLKAALDKHFNVSLLNFAGHGGKDIPDSFSIEAFAGDVLAYLQQYSVTKIDILGYSMGGYVGLYLCRHYPEKVNRLMTVATKLDWNPEGAKNEVKMLDPEVIEQKVPAFAKQLAERHSPADWKAQMQRTAAMMLEMGAVPALTDEDYAQIQHPVLLSVGDRDKMVSIEETIGVYRQLPAGNFWCIPGTAHPVEKMPLEKLAAAAKSFFTGTL